MANTRKKQFNANTAKKMSNNRGLKKGQGALRAGSAFKKSSAPTKVHRDLPGSAKADQGPQSHFRSKSTIKRLNMYKMKLSPKEKESRKKQSLGPVRIAPDRKWFGNTRVITQDKMQTFREKLSKSVDDPFSVVLKTSKLPMSLLKDTEKASRMNLLSIEPYTETFGKKKQRKRVKLQNYDLEGLMQASDEKAGKYSSEQDKQIKFDLQTGEAHLKTWENHSEEIFGAGTSKRIYAELYKVIDSSDVIIEVLDARDPMGTRCYQLEKEVKKNHPHKHIILLYNKCDLVPTWVTKRWVTELAKEYPTLAFHASITNPFGKNALINLLRQFGMLLKDRKHVSVGMLGYPNVGKSSVINTLKRKKVCKSAPIPGETKVWQYITLTKKIYMIDCPGVVPPTKRDFEADQAKVLKGAVRAERVENPSDYIDEVISRVRGKYLCKRYKLPLDTTWKDGEEFLTILARKMGKLGKGGETDWNNTARIVLYDWQRGRIPYYTAPPELPDLLETTQAASSSSTSSSKEPKKEGEPDKIETPTVVQSFQELECIAEFDKEDLGVDGQNSQEVKETTEKQKKAIAETGEAPTQKNLKKRNTKESGEAPKKKKIRRGGGSKPGAPSQTPDWGNLTAEFDA